MYKYAQINNEGICFSKSLLSGIVDSPDMILLTDEDYDKPLLGKKYVSGLWEDIIPDMREMDESPSQLDEIQANLDYLVMINS